MNPLQRYLNNVRAYWFAQSLALRVGFAFLVLLIVVIAAFSTGSLTGTTYAVIYRDLTPEEAGAIVARLKALNITYQFDDGGSKIKVPEDALVSTRVALAAEGFPARGKGFEIFDEGSLAVPPDVQKINYLRALQGELARSIMQIDSVQTARVHLARPEPSPFVRDAKVVTASVVVKLRPGRQLNRGQAAGVVALVARAVEGLKPENVILVDTNGMQISDSRPPEGDGAPSRQIEYRQELERYLASKAEALLGAHLGGNRAVVRVSADIDFKRVREWSKKYEQPGVVSAERTMEEKSTAASQARGVAGAASNVRQAGGTGGGGSGTSSGNTAQTDYLVPVTERTIEDHLGGVTRLTVAAMLDLSPLDGENPRPTISVADAQDIIKQAIGFKTGRDDIKVTDVKLASLDKPLEEEKPATIWDRSAAIVALVRNGALALTALVILAMLSMIFLRRGRSTAAGAAPGAPAAPLTPEERERQEEERRRRELEQFVELARRDPDAVATMIVNMLGGAEPAPV